MHRFVTTNTRETEELGESLGRSIAAGTVLGLSGDLGAGKTAFVRGLARGIGCPRRVHSPTFGLLHEYTGGRLPLFHLDLYRLAGPDEIRTAGLVEYLHQPPGVTVAEWIERWEDPQHPSGSIRHVRFRCLDETTREICHDHPLA